MRTHRDASITRNRSGRKAWSAALVGLVAVFVALPSVSQALPRSVVIRDNSFNPKELRIDPGDSVTWNNQGALTHSIQSDPSADDGNFKSEDLQQGESFSEQFPEVGYYIYFCKFHGSRGRVGMWGVVIVGDALPPPDLEIQKDIRPKLIVPDDFPTIQKAVDAAAEGSTISIKPGTYYEDVVVTTPNLVIQGVDRFRTILHGQDKLTNGITVDGTHDIVVRNMTVRNYLSNGIYFNDVNGYTVNRVDAIKDRVYGVYAFDSYNGVFKNSLGWGAGDSAFYVGQCLGCGALLQNLRSAYNFLGYSGTNATGVTIRDSIWRRNAIGIVPNTLYSEEDAPNRGTVIINNIVENNNYAGIPPAGFSETGHVHGIGIWLAGTQNNIAMHNTIQHHENFGVLVSQFLDKEASPMNNEVRNNYVRDSGAADLAWDGIGADNCFSGNDIDGATSPPMMQSLFSCDRRPFVGVPYAPTWATIAAGMAADLDREIVEPPEPKRPSCQRGRPGCHR